MKDENLTQEELNIIMGQCEAGYIPASVLSVMSAQDQRNILIFNKIFENVKTLNLDLQEQLTDYKKETQLEFFHKAFYSASSDPADIIKDAQLAILKLVKFDIIAKDDTFHDLTCSFLQDLGDLINYFNPPTEETFDTDVKEEFKKKESNNENIVVEDHAVNLEKTALVREKIEEKTDIIDPIIPAKKIVFEQTVVAIEEERINDIDNIIEQTKANLDAEIPEPLIVTAVIESPTGEQILEVAEPVMLKTIITPTERIIIEEEDPFPDETDEFDELE